MASANKAGFYLDGRYLGKDYNEAFYNLDDKEIPGIVYDYIVDSYDLEDLAQMASINALPEDVGFLKEAFEKIEVYAAIRRHQPYAPPIFYGELEWRDGPTESKSVKSRKSPAKRKAPAKKATSRRR